MRFTLLTLFPEFFSSPFQQSILKRAQTLAQDPVELKVLNIRDFSTDKHKTTDDRPYGGGPGMVMKIEPIHNALESLSLKKNQANKKIILTSAKGKLFTQHDAQLFSQLSELTIICGHYEGVDERVSEHLVDEEMRIGNFVLTGGEAAAIVMVDAITRLIPGILGNEESVVGESHNVEGELEYPQYTRPEEYNNWRVPRVLLDGNHAEIENWREENKKLIRV